MKRSNYGTLVWVFVLIFLNCGGGFLNILMSGISDSSGQAEYDYYMRTDDYRVDIQVEDDNSYTVTEQIQVNFLENRHGIYRYIPLSGTSCFLTEDGKERRLPYGARISGLAASAPLSAYKENGNAVLRLGDEDSYVYGPTSYLIRYNLRPGFQQKDFDRIYYNIFPLGWTNDIPAGSSFSVTFPKEVDASKIRFYSGAYGSTADASGILDCTVDGTQLTGTLTETLPMGSGLTLYADVGEGYFSSVLEIPSVLGLPILVSLIALAGAVGLFFLFGRDEPIIPSIQYQPPDDLDSGAVGYIVDGVVENRDVISLIIYWADKGYLSIHEDEDGELSFEQKGFLPADTPQYQKVMFNRLFLNGNTVSLNSLKYKFSDTIETVKKTIQDSYSGSRGLYSPQSKVARVIATVLCGLPLASYFLAYDSYSGVGSAPLAVHVLLLAILYLGVYVYCRGIDRWYGNSSAARRRQVILGLVISFACMILYTANYLIRAHRGQIFRYPLDLGSVIVSTAVIVVLTGFMRKRTHQCIEWMGRLAGLRDFIETAELERMEVLAQENPEWFYHIIPYAYVFGLSDVFAKKLKGLELAPPDWYVSGRSYGDSYFDYYMFHHMFMNNMSQVSQTLTVPKPPSSGSSSGGSGGFSGGGFSSGGGGFSGGGFGGGGGGSW